MDMEVMNPRLQAVIAAGFLTAEIEEAMKDYSLEVESVDSVRASYGIHGETEKVACINDACAVIRINFDPVAVLKKSMGKEVFTKKSQKC